MGPSSAAGGDADSARAHPDGIGQTGFDQPTLDLSGGDQTLYTQAKQRDGNRAWIDSGLY